MVIGGVSNSGKSRLLNRTTLVEEEIGVSFQSLECLVNDGDTYKFILWDLNAKKIFRFMYPQFCRGAKAALLFFDLSNSLALTELSFWIDVFKKSVKNMPIILIGTLTDAKKMCITNKQIKEFIEKNDLNRIYFILLNDDYRREEKEKIFKYLIQLIATNDEEIKSFKIISPLEDPEFMDFFQLFCNCPICHSKNHENYLAKFFYSQEEEDVRLKNLLQDLVYKFINIPLDYYNTIRFGIPCCKCYKKFCIE
ncbi:MAG: hypothetical protein ACFFAS_10685 [Promethearchaeota archaeon]